MFVIYIKVKNILIEGDIEMAKDKNKRRFMAVPIEKHDTAAWANVEKLKPVSNVNIPDDEQVRNAKEYVDSNEK